LLYLLDANVLIDANRDYYSIDRVPEFWEWLAFMGNESKVKIPKEIIDELKDGKDKLADWSKEKDTETALELNEEPDMAQVTGVVEVGYAPDLTDDEIEELGKDPILIAYALRQNPSRCVVTTEASKPGRQGKNRHVPDVCATFSIQWCNAFEFGRALDFKTNWKDFV